MVENSKPGKGKGFLPLFLGQFCANKILWELFCIWGNLLISIYD